MSIEGEAKYTGHPTAYIRFARCNFQCRGFNNPENLDTTSVSVLGFDPKDYNNIYSIPLIHKGCDSIYSWDKNFEHMWKKGSSSMLGQEVLKVLPHNSFINPKSGKRVILSLTGGEPTLRMKFIPELLHASELNECRHVLIETNCAVPLKNQHLKELALWAHAKQGHITWSNSPKLSISGEKWNEAIRPEIALAQIEALQMLVGTKAKGGDQYFKFVCDASDQSFEEVEQAMSEYYASGVPKETEIYIMPVACTEEQQQEVAASVAVKCIDRGFIYCHRIQNSVFGNGVGT